MLFAGRVAQQLQQVQNPQLKGMQFGHSAVEQYTPQNRPFSGTSSAPPTSFSHPWQNPSKFLQSTLSVSPSSPRQQLSDDSTQMPAPVNTMPSMQSFAPASQMLSHSAQNNFINNLIQQPQTLPTSQSGGSIFGQQSGAQFQTGRGETFLPSAQQNSIDQASQQVHTHQFSSPSRATTFGSFGTLPDGWLQGSSGLNHAFGENP